jgi:hypothetical protein
VCIGRNPIDTIRKNAIITITPNSRTFEKGKYVCDFELSHKTIKKNKLKTLTIAMAETTTLL